MFGYQWTRAIGGAVIELREWYAYLAMITYGNQRDTVVQVWRTLSQWQLLTQCSSTDYLVFHHLAANSRGSKLTQKLESHLEIIESDRLSNGTWTHLSIPRIDATCPTSL